MQPNLAESPQRIVEIPRNVVAEPRSPGSTRVMPSSLFKLMQVLADIDVALDCRTLFQDQKGKLEKESSEANL